MQTRSTEAEALERPLKKPENQINVKALRDYAYYIYHGRMLLQAHEAIEFHGIGDAIENSVKAADMLVRYQFAEIKSIRTETITADSREGQVKKAKIFISLTKHKKFEANMEHYLLVSLMNQKIIDQVFKAVSNDGKILEISTYHLSCRSLEPSDWSK